MRVRVWVCLYVRVRVRVRVCDLCACTWLSRVCVRVCAWLSRVRVCVRVRGSRVCACVCVRGAGAGAAEYGHSPRANAHCALGSVSVKACARAKARSGPVCARA